MPDDVSRIGAVNYNTLVPHYQLGYALYYNGFESFIKYLDPDYRNN